MKAPSLLVLSKASFESVNRTAYRVLAARHSVPVHLVIPSRLVFPGGSKEPVDPPGETLAITRLPMGLGSQGRLEYFKGMGELIERVRPTHILVENEPASLMMTLAARHARRIGARVWSLSCENLERNHLREAWDGLKSLRPKAVAAGLINHALHTLNRGRLDHVLAMSRDGCRVMERAGFGGRVTQTPLGFDPMIFHKQDAGKIAATRKRIGLDRRAFAYFGRITPEKGVDLLVQALGGLLDRPWQLLIDDFDRYRSPYLEKVMGLLESTGVKERVVFFRASHTEIADYMNAADIVVLPSVSTPKWKEQYGRVIPEAMACGKVVVGSDSGTVPELIAESGFIFREGNVEDLRAILSRLLAMSDAELDRIGEAGRQRALAAFSADAQADILLRVMQDNP